MSIDNAKRVLKIEAEAILALIDRLDSHFNNAVDILYKCQGKVVVIGIGKSGLIAAKIASTFSSTGSKFSIPIKLVTPDCFFFAM